jgi:amino acid transporter
MDHLLVVLPPNYYVLTECFNPGSFDSSVHISEEASNAATAVPWAIVNAVGIAGILGVGMLLPSKDFCPRTN